MKIAKVEPVTVDRLSATKCPVRTRLHDYRSVSDQ